MRHNIKQEAIGVIVREIEGKLRLASPNGFDEPSFEQMPKIDLVYKQYDNALCGRPDYRLWRLHLRPYYSYPRPWLYDIQTASSALSYADLSQLLRICVESDDPVVQWSTVALAPDIIKQIAKGPGNISKNELFELMRRLAERLEFEFLPLDYCPASCGMVSFFFLLSYQNAGHKNGLLMGAEECRKFLDSVINALKQAAPGWIPGFKPNLDELQKERRSIGRLAPSHDAFENVRFAKTLALLRPTISASVSEWSPTTESLLSDAYDLSISGWLVARSLRISAIMHQRSRGFFDGKRAKEERRKAFKNEMQMLLHLGNAARDAGRYLDVSKWIYLYLRTIPDEFIDESWIRDELKKRSGIFHYVGEGALRKDGRFPRERNQGLIEAKTRGRQVGWDKLLDEARSADEIAYPLDSGSPTGVVLRMAQEMRVLPEWQVVLKHVSAKGQSHWGYLLTIEKSLADAGFEAAPEVLSATYFLALRYGHVRSAAKILARAIGENKFPITPDHLIEFVHAVRKATQLDPFGMRLDYLEFWQKMIVEGYQTILCKYGKGCLSSSEILWLHETIINRTITLYGNLASEDASLLYQSNSGLVSAHQMRCFYEEAFDFHRRAPGVANTDTIARYLSEVFDVSGRNAVALSVVRFGDYLSFLAVGKYGNRIAKIEVNGPSDEEVIAILSGASQWFEYPDISFEEQIYWSSSMVRLATTAIRLARDVEEHVDTIFFAGEPWLMQLPLQHLFYAKGNADVLVCLTPNLSSLPRRRGVAREKGLANIQSTDDDPEMQLLVRKISELTLEYGESVEKSVVTIVGHGTLGGEQGLPRISLGEEKEIATANDWLDHLTGDAILIHSCHLASTEPIHIGDLGGAVGLAFSIGCSAFVAPVTEVYAETAEFLHRSLIGWSGGIGDGYMEALRENGEVSLYSFYGDPCLVLCELPRVF